jgi:hypothetical protein
VYLLGVSLVVIAAGFAAVEASLSSLAAHRLHAAADEARLLAQSGIEIAVHRMMSNQSWPSSLGAGGTIVNNQAVSRGRVHVVIIDPVDNNPANGENDPILVRSTATVGSAVRIAEVELRRRWNPLPIIQTAVHAATGVTFNIGTGITADRPVSSNTGASATSASINARVEVVTTASGGVYGGGVIEGVPIKTMPPADIVAQYAALATPILRSALGRNDINRQLLSPTVNPYGANLNARGIYVVDMGNNDMEIRSSRIFGTLVVRNAKSVRICEGVVWEPAFPGLPSLIAEGPIWIDGNTDTLSESAVGRNLNPPSTPYKGVSNTTTSDNYPSRLEGVFYATGLIRIRQPRPVLLGTLVAGTDAVFENTYGVTYDTRVSEHPPMGFRTGPDYIMVPGSWKRIVP